MSGALSLSRFDIHFEKRRPTHSWSQLNKLLDPWKAPPVSLERKLAPEIAGWVFPSGSKALAMMADEDLPPDHPWDLEMCSVQGVTLLRLRIEKRQVPNQLLQELYRHEIYQHVAKFGQNPKPAEKKQIKQDLQNQLTRRALPSIQYVDGLWFIDDQKLWVMSTGKRQRDVFKDYFTKTFLAPLQGVALETTAPLMALKNLTDPADSEQSTLASETLKLLSSTVPVSMATAGRGAL